MPKNRLSAIDVRAICSELQHKIISLRLANVYDINNKTYLFKFAKPDNKVHVLVESGIRMHTTQFERDKNKLPNSFSMKLRKLLRTRRCEKVEQLGVDRVIDITFSGGGGNSEYSDGFHLLFEFFAKGNIILTDAKYKILALLRIHSKEENATFAVGHEYPMQNRRQFQQMQMTTLQQVIQSQPLESPLFKVLNSNFDYGTHFIEHCFTRLHLPTQMTVKEWTTQDTLWPKLLQELNEADQFITSCQNKILQGFIILRKPNSKMEEEMKPEMLYDDFCPFLFEQFKQCKYVTFDTFDQCLDEYFSKLESIKIEQAKLQAEKQVVKKMDKVKEDQVKRIKELEQTQEEMNRFAQLIEENAEEVEDAITIINSAVAQEIDWNEIKQVIKEQKKAGNPIAQIIHQLKLETNQITLLLKPKYSDEEDTLVPVDVDIGMSAYGNAQQFYQAKKKTAAKFVKTVEASSVAIKAAEKKSREQYNKTTKQIADIQLMRKRLWFEKFNWFITSENYLVLLGKDAQQNEQLVKKYLNKGDVYMHLEHVIGSPSCIIKNPNSNNPISHLSLMEAAQLIVCRSSAWDNKIVTQAYWVQENQVSKTAPSGEYLTTGSFMVRGKKNFMPSQQLVVGLGILFKVDESCLPHHIGERKVREAISEEEAMILESLQNEEGEEQQEDTSSKRDSEEEEEEKEEIPQQEQEEEEQQQQQQEKEEEDEQKQSSKQRLSVVDRKRIKNLIAKGYTQPQAQEILQKGSYFEVMGITPPTKTDEKENGSDDGDSKSKTRVSNTGNKKSKTKYVEQDEEDRQLRMEFLGNKKKETKPNKKDKKSQQSNTTKGGKQSGKPAQQPPKSATPQQPQLQPQEQTQQQVPIDTTVSEEQQQEVKQEDEVKKKDRAKARREEREELKQLLEDENITLLDDKMREQLTDLDSLTGQPREDDILLFALPVLAPYSTLKNYKYKIKLVPGSQKRGKAGKTIMEQFLMEAKPSEKEHLLIKNISDTDLTTAMIGNVKIASSISVKKPSKKKNAKSTSNAPQQNEEDTTVMEEDE